MAIKGRFLNMTAANERVVRRGAPIKFAPLDRDTKAPCGTYGTNGGGIPPVAPPPPPQAVTAHRMDMALKIMSIGVWDRAPALMQGASLRTMT